MIEGLTCPPLIPLEIQGKADPAFGHCSMCPCLPRLHLWGCPPCFPPPSPHCCSWTQFRTHCCHCPSWSRAAVTLGSIPKSQGLSGWSSSTYFIFLTGTPWPWENFSERMQWDKVFVWWSPPMEAMMRKLRRAGDPVNAIEGEGSKSATYRQCRMRLELKLIHIIVNEVLLHKNMKRIPTLWVGEEYGREGSPRRKVTDFDFGCTAPKASHHTCPKNEVHQTCHQSRIWTETITNFVGIRISILLG